MLLSDFQHPFDVISLSETRIKNSYDLTRTAITINIVSSNYAINEYDFLSKPTLTNAGSVGSMLTRGFHFIFEVTDLCLTTKESESLWIAINRYP